MACAATRCDGGAARTSTGRGRGRCSVTRAPRDSRSADACPRTSSTNSWPWRDRAAWFTTVRKSGSRGLFGERGLGDVSLRGSRGCTRSETCCWKVAGRVISRVRCNVYDTLPNHRGIWKLETLEIRGENERRRVETQVPAKLVLRNVCCPVKTGPRATAACKKASARDSLSLPGQRAPRPCRLDRGGERKALDVYILWHFFFEYTAGPSTTHRGPTRRRCTSPGSSAVLGWATPRP